MDKRFRRIGAFVLHAFVVLGVSVHLLTNVGDTTKQQGEHFGAPESATVMMVGEFPLFIVPNSTTAPQAPETRAHETVAEYPDYGLVRPYHEYAPITTEKAPEVGVSHEAWQQVVTRQMETIDRYLHQSPALSELEDNIGEVEDPGRQAYTSSLYTQPRNQPTDLSASWYIDRSAMRTMLAQYDWDVETALLVSYCESRFNAHAVNDSPPREVSIGLFQINILAQRSYLEEFSGTDDLVPWLKSPGNNVRYAYALYAHLGWKPWKICGNRVQNGLVTIG